MINEYRIWQVKTERIRSWGFMNLGALRRLHRLERADGLTELPRDVWQEVYVYRTEKTPGLDWIFTLFNDAMDGMDRPGDFPGHSMSVSDIIEDPEGRLWFCDSMKWEEVRWKQTAE